MALKDFSCRCGRTFESITGAHIGGTVACPDCGRTDAKELFTAASFGASMGFDYANRPAGERIEALNQKKYLEANSEQILSGQMAYRHPKGLPKEFAPVVPEHLKKTYG